MFDDTSNRSIIRSEQHLTADSPPPEIVGREAEIHNIRDAVRPLTEGKTPDNLLVYGPPGSGKTVCVNHVFNALENETRVKTIRINCWQYRTRPSLLTELLIQLGYPAPRKGKPVDTLLKLIGTWLDKNRSIAVALDEFDRFEDKAEIIYDLHMLSQQSENKLGLILVSNLPPEEFLLDSRSRSRLNCRTLEFQPYTAEELQEILSDRVEKAFEPGAVQPEVIETVAEEVAESGGDCRDAFERLRQAGRRASQENAHKITPQFLIDG
ncbi:Cdc6/Cdc18 family protein [Halopiger aswanensis]|uniref:Cell division control protein 6 n=1 Tax=Halopiger aswanensis TaxID=148449 RepID=A0A419WJH6_9EURY|nr:AAA family ATPase [Halopiger aswanensis]RKD95618.1 cell division control protein 6 [Halopiger aswanensis]